MGVEVARGSERVPEPGVGASLARSAVTVLCQGAAHRSREQKCCAL